MVILYIHQYFTTPSGSGGTRSYEMAQSLIRHGHQVKMICGSNHPNYEPTNKKNIFRGFVDNIEVIQIKNAYSGNLGLMGRARAFLSFSLKCITFALKEDYDVLFATSTPLTAGIPGIVMKLFRKKNFIFEIRDLWPELPKALGVKNPFWIGGMSAIEWLSYHSADGCIGLSPGICKGIRRRSQKDKPIELIPNGCDLELFKPSLKGAVELKGIDVNDKVAIFAGAHGIANGLDAILDAAKEVKRRGRHDIKFVFVGKGNMKTHLLERKEKESIDNCLFYDPIPKPQLAKLMASAMIGMMVLKNVPAFYYGTSPNKFFDYIASGLPVINNYPGWLADMITENKLGVVVEPDNPQAFADGLIMMMDNPQLLDEYSKNARAFAENNFDRTALGDKFVSFIEKIYNIN